MAHQAAQSAHQAALAALDQGGQLGERVTRLEQGQLPDATALPEQGPPFEEGLLNPPPRFIGRADDLEWLLPRLRAGGAVGITALGGIGGIGKTALAGEAVRRLRAEGRFPDGVAVVLCQNMTDAVEVLRAALARFDPRRLPPTTADRAALAGLAHALLDGKDALIVLDNVEPALDVEQVVAPLRATGVTLLLTARERLSAAAVPAEATRPLRVLEEPDAMDLFAAYYGRGDAQDFNPAERAAVEALVEALGRHTLAVKLAAAYAFEQQRPLDVLAHELADPQRALVLLPDSDAPQAVRASFAQSYDALPPGARRIFAALAAFGTPEFGRLAAQALGQGLGQPELEARGHVELLVRRSLLDASVNDSKLAESDRERLRLHPLLLGFAQLLFALWPDDERAAAGRVLAEYYAGYAPTVSFAARAADAANIAAALEAAHARGDEDLVLRLCRGMQYFWRDTGRPQASLTYLPWAIAAAEDRLGPPPDPAAPADALAAWRDRADMLFWLLLNYGFAYQITGKLDQASDYYTRCLDLARQAQHRRDEGAALSVLGQIAQRRGRLDEAEGYLQQSLLIRREVQDRQGEGADLSSLGQIALRRGRLDEAEGYLQQSLLIHREVQDRQGEGVVLSSLGQIAQRRGRLDEAEGYFQQSLLIRREVQDRQGEGVVLSSLGQIALPRPAGRPRVFPAEPADPPRGAGPQGEGADLSSLGQIAQRRGRLDEAEVFPAEPADPPRGAGPPGRGRGPRDAGQLLRSEAETTVAEALLPPETCHGIEVQRRPGSSLPILRRVRRVPHHPTRQARRGLRDAGGGGAALRRDGHPRRRSGAGDGAAAGVWRVGRAVGDGPAGTL